MKTTYLGLELESPVIVSSSPFTADPERIARCVRHGAGAVVLKSIFEEQIVREAAAIEYASQQPGMGDAGEYVFRYLGEEYKARFLCLIREARATGVSVIASINCIVGSEAWVEYAVAMEQAGASALELNIFLQPTDACLSSQQLEHHYAATVGRVAEAVGIPVSVKLPMRLTNVLALAAALQARGARGVVLFNRFFEPDIDIERMAFTAGEAYSRPSELRNVLRSAALCATVVPQLDVAVSTGVHDGEAAVKAILCGASAVEVCTAIHRFGYEAIGEIGRFIDRWARRHGFSSLEAFRGRMDFGHAGDDMYQRVQYMKYFPQEGR